MSRLACPRCLRDDTLYENVTIDGWRDIAFIEIVDGRPRAEPGRRRDREADWDHVEVTGYGCSCCDDDLRLRDLVQLDRDGEVVPGPAPGQAELGDVIEP